MDLAWMAWTTPTAIFFACIASLILMMCIWEVFSPGGAPRDGLLGLHTTRGDRLFMSLVFNAFVALAWLAFVPLALYWVLPVCLTVAVLIFMFF